MHCSPHATHHQLRCFVSSCSCPLGPPTPTRRSLPKKKQTARGKRKTTSWRDDSAEEVGTLPTPDRDISRSISFARDLVRLLDGVKEPRIRLHALEEKLPITGFASKQALFDQSQFAPGKLSVSAINLSASHVQDLCILLVLFWLLLFPTSKQHSSSASWSQRCLLPNPFSKRPLGFFPKKPAISILSCCAPSHHSPSCAC